MTIPLSKQVLTGFLATIVLTAIVLLQPEADMNAVEDAVLVVERDERHARTTDESATPWLRELPPQHTAMLDRGFVLLPPPPPPAPPIIFAPIEPPKPVVPNPAFTYLGRMMRDDKVYVFLGRGEDVDMVAIGDAVDGSWRVEGVSDTSVELLYLPLNEVRQLAMSEN